MDALYVLYYLLCHLALDEYATGLVMSENGVNFAGQEESVLLLIYSHSGSCPCLISLTIQDTVIGQYVYWSTGIAHTY